MLDAPLSDQSPTPAPPPRGTTTGRFRSLLINLSLAAASLVLSLAAVELSLRLFFPKYDYAADARLAPDEYRLWSRMPNTRVPRPHPDTAAQHEVAYNNLGLRQSGDLTPEALDRRVNIAFFGDSFTENVRLPYEYTFAAMLDALLNRDGDKYNILNFGVDGYGTSQSYLYYLHSDVAQRADHVFYIFYSNDLRNLYETNLLGLRADGTLEFTGAQSTPPLIRLASNFYTTYFVLELRAILRDLIKGEDSAGPAPPTAGSLMKKYMQRERSERHRSAEGLEIDERFIVGDFAAIADWIDLFKGIVRTWESEVRANGGEFSIVVVPQEQEANAARLLGDEFRVVNLLEMARRALPDYAYEDYRFRNDAHWNEAGNLLAAVFLFRELEQALGLDRLPDADLVEFVHRYYAGIGDAHPPLPEDRLLALISLPPLSSGIAAAATEAEAVGP
jgi:hypothetical protein